jgi:RNA polymerase sigma-70 factor (ECF subfamily)
MSDVELIRACAELDDGAAWAEFVERFRRPISLSIIRTADQWGQAPQEVVDDLVQETYLKLCADKCQLLLKFAVLHPDAVHGYIKTIAINVARDHFKALHSQKRGSGEVGQFLEDTEPKAATDGIESQEAIEREVLFKQINEYVETCSAGPDQHRDCVIFWLYYQQGMSAKAIAALPAVGLTAKGVESAILRLTRLVRKKIVDLRPGQVAESTKREKGFRPAESY